MSKKNKPESREYQLTIDNPKDHNFDLEKIKDIIHKGAKYRYFCMSAEQTKEGMYHIHFYIVFTNNVRWNTMKNKFPPAHIENSLDGTPEENRDYVFKEGKWLNDPKGETNLRDTHYEEGECPHYEQGKRNDLNELYTMIESGYSNADILKINKDMIRYIDKMDRVRKTIQADQQKNQWRDVEVTYIWGTTGSGKTRYVMDKYGYSNVYRVTDYLHPFDSYTGQQIILFEEFSSSMRIEDMLKYLDGYPVELACRYSNQQALFTKVYFCTNIDLRQQYPNIQKEEKETWKAFLRRIHNVMVFRSKEEILTAKTKEYLENVFMFFDNPYEESVQLKLDI